MVLVMHRNVPPSLPRVLVWQVRRQLWAVALLGLTLAGATVHGAEVGAVRPTPRSPKIDHAVTQAGGNGSGRSACSQCQRSACPQCRIAEGTHHGHRPCSHGLCPAHCPVRPDVFGFYGTRWRRWPGSGVVQVSNDDAVTPARPPKAEVPGPREESFEPDPPADDLPAPDAVEPAARFEPAEPAKPVEQVKKVEPVKPVEPAKTADEVGSSTAWRSFTAAERQKQQIQQ